MMRRILGTVPLLVSAGAALLLVLDQSAGLTMRGCGPGSGCASLTAGPWGSLFGWPVSYLGLAYFLGLLAAWQLSDNGIGPVLRWLVRLGAIASVGFLIAMFSESHFCPYCLAVHLGNFAFLAVMETSAQAARPHMRPLAGLVGLFVLASLGLGIARSEVQATVAEQAQQETSAAVKEVVAAAALQPAGEPAFTGRWRLGPEVAPIRIVMWGDYQCQDCRETEAEMEPLLDDNVSFSFLHYPLCKDCNRLVKHPRFHDNACRAAYAAEAAGILDGEDGFWRMHHWLIDHKGKFTDEELGEALPELGFDDAERFFARMNGPEVKRLVETDIERAIAVGIDGTPLVFINGVELESADVPGNVTAAVQQLLQEDLPPRPPHVDQPRGRIERLVERWQGQDPITFPPQPEGHILGPKQAPHRLTLVLDYANPYSVQLDRVARQLVEQRDDVAFQVITYPLAKGINPRFEKWESDFYGPSEPMARLVTAASQLGGDEAFWTMHRWVLQHQNDFDLQAGLQAARDAGLAVEQVEQRMQSAEVEEALQANIAALEALEITWASTLYLDGKRITAAVPSRDLLEQMLATTK